MKKARKKPSSSRRKTARLPLLPLRDTVVFPRMVVPLMIARPASLVAIEECLAADCPLFLATQKDATVESPGAEDVHTIGVAAQILQSVRMPDGAVKIVVEGLGRGRILQMAVDGPYPQVLVARIDAKPLPDKLGEALIRTLLSQFQEYVRLSQRIAPEVVQSLEGITDPDMFADLMCAHLHLRVADRQEVLETLELKERYERLMGLLMRENDLLRIEQQVRDRVREHIENNQREYYLHEQIRALHQELGERSEGHEESEELRQQIDKAGMPEEIKEKALRELGRFERMPPMSPESAIIRTYIEWLAEMPWTKRSTDSLDLVEAAKVLDRDHYGLTKVKERILEYLAVHTLNPEGKGPILCLVGPPGVGKTSLGRSIAHAMGRQFVRVSLGGVRDEAEIRGHRRTYIGALPGRIIQGMKKAEVCNPVFMLDEVDKMSVDFRGDPSSALLEVLDPEQNRNFSDHYLEVDFDLHEVFFITTANNEFEIPYALYDRLETVTLSGYTSMEKLQIARQFLIPKQMKECGLDEKTLRFEDDGIDTLIQHYTREAGVRELERQIAAVCRKVARKIVEAKAKVKAKAKAKKNVLISVGKAEVESLLGPSKYTDPRAEVRSMIGVAVGLAWTVIGGEILNVETSLMKGKGELMITGQVGDVMKESGQAVHTYLRSHAEELRIPKDFAKNTDVHIHVPEGAIPKDGPSAGLPIAVSMLSALRNQAPRGALAMTGEITLRGRVLPVGGIKEKVLAAHRAGVDTVVIPKDNEKDIPEIPEEVRKDITLIPVETMDEALAIAFPKKKGVRGKTAARKRAVRKPQPKRR